ncbi:unnamed protein product, partial [Bodo saltans]
VCCRANPPSTATANALQQTARRASPQLQWCTPEQRLSYCSAFASEPETSLLPRGGNDPEPCCHEGVVDDAHHTQRDTDTKHGQVRAAKTTRQRHRRILRDLANLPEPLHHAPLLTALVEHINVLRRTKRWQWSTCLTKMAAPRPRS